MAAPAKKKKPKPIPKSAGQKSAEDALTRAQQVSLAQTSARVQGASRGAFKGRKLRSSGTDMMQYDLGRFTNDPFPDLPGVGGQGGGGGGGGQGTQRTTGGGGGGKPAKPQAPAPKQPVNKKRVKEQKKAQSHNERPGTVNGPNVTEARLAREALAREKAKAAAKAKALAAKKLANAHSTKKVTGGHVQS